MDDLKVDPFRVKKEKEKKMCEIQLDIHDKMMEMIS